MTGNQEPLRILQGKKGTYEIIRPIGRGGFGYTFLAEDLTAVVEKRYCVVKQLRMDVYHDPKTIAGIKRSFKREARVLQNLGQRSGNIPSLDDYFSITVTDPVLHIPQEFNFLVQQYIEGEDLGEELKQQGLFSETKVLDLLKNILPVLKFIHNNNVIHRDIKPSNIIRSTEEENKFYLIDFGAVKQVIKGDIDTKETSIVFGDGNYAPPEQRSREEVNASSDLYALAATCVRLLTGEFYIHSRGVNNLWNWEKYPHISEPLGKILRKMLQEESYYRYQSATEVIEALDKMKSSTNTKIDPSDDSDDTKGVIKPRTREVIEATDKPSKGKKINSKDDTKVINPNPFLNFIKKLGNNPSSRTQSIPVTFQNLEALLEAGKWRDADLETWELMLKLTKREQERWLRIEDVKNFPRQELRKMDQLWVKYSNGKFGFSVQKQIWLELGGKLDGEPDWDTYKKLGDRVGWRQNGKWFKLYNSYIFSTNGPSGQLPALWVWGDAVDVVMVCIWCLYGLDYFFGFVLALLLGFWGVDVMYLWAVSLVVLMLVYGVWWVVGGLVGFACGWGGLVGFGGLGGGFGCLWLRFGGGGRSVFSFLFSRL
jgi:serine/threonine protein kinase